MRFALVTSFNQLIRSTPAQETEIWNRIHRYANRQTTLAILSGKRSQAMSYKKFEAADRMNDFYHFTASRPYLITSPTPAEAVEVVKSLRSCKNPEEATKIFDLQLEALGDLYAELDAPYTTSADLQSEWDSLKRNVQKLKQMRSCYYERRPFVTDFLVPVTFEVEGEEISGLSLDEMEAGEISVAEIPSHYGQLLGSTLGRIAGLCEPTWWLGRNYWIGLLCFSRLGMMKRVKFGKFQKHIIGRSANPARLFQDIELPGFESGFDLTCPAYSTGLLFTEQNISSLLQSLNQSRDEWENLSAMLTGYPPDAIKNAVDLIEEALLWAKSENCALLEGDELVGSLGYR